MTYNIINKKRFFLKIKFWRIIIIGSRATTNASSFIKSIVICKDTGEYLLDIALDSDIDPTLLSSFVGALSLFYNYSLGKLKEINIKSENEKMYVMLKYNLILILIMDKDFYRNDILHEVEMILDIFYSSFQEEINDPAVDETHFKEFKHVIRCQIQDYLNLIENSESDDDIKIPQLSF